MRWPPRLLPPALPIAPSPHPEPPAAAAASPGRPGRRDIGRFLVFAGGRALRSAGNDGLAIALAWLALQSLGGLEARGVMEKVQAAAA